MDPRFTKFPRKSFQLFFVTVKDTSLSKEHVFLSLEDFCMKLVVGEEWKDGASTHLIFIKTPEKHRPQEIQAIVEKIYELDEYKNDQRLHIHLGSSRHQRDALKFISRRDTTLFSKGVSSRELSFFYRSVEWARNTPIIESSDVFVAQHPRYCHKLRDIHATVRQNIDVPRMKLYRRYEVAPGELLLDWQREVVHYWNNLVDNGWQENQKHLLLCGPIADMECFIYRLLSKSISKSTDEKPDSYLERIFTPMSSQHRRAGSAFLNFNPNLHSVLVASSFIEEDFDLNELEKFICGGPIQISHRDAQYSTHSRIPMFFLIDQERSLASGEAIQKSILERLIHVNINSNLAQEGALAFDFLYYLKLCFSKARSLFS